MIALDAEWDSQLSRSRNVVQAFRTAVIQLGYRDTEGRMSALILQVSKHLNQPQSLLSLFGDTQIAFVGASVSGDLKRIGKDFSCTEVNDCVNCVNLGSYARKRDIVQDDTASLECWSSLH